MKKVLSVLIAGVFVVMSANIISAGEKGSMKGSGYEEKGSAADHKSDANKAKIQDVMKNYVTENSTDGVMELKDPKSGKTRKLSFIDLHSKVGMKDDKHYSCADFKDLDTNEILDVDLFVDVNDEGGVEVTEAVIHKVVEKSSKGSGSESKESEKGSMKKGSGY